MPTADSGHRGLIFEIQGSLTNLVSYVGLPVAWGTARTGLVAPPVNPTLSVDPRTMEADAGGTSVIALNIDDLLEQYKTEPTALLTADADAGDATITVDDTTPLPASGHIWIGKNAVSYAGKTATTLTGCVWGALGTQQRDELIGAVVYGWNPEIFDRQAWLYWYDPQTATKTLQFTGYIDDIDIKEDGTHITLLSAKAKLIQNPALGAPFAEGYLLSEVAASGPAPLLVSLLDPDNPIDNENGLLQRLHVRIDDEIIEYAQLIKPRISVNIDLIPGTNQARTNVQGAALFETEVVDIVDGSSVVQDTVQITKIAEVSTGVWQIDYSTSTGYTPSVNDDLVANYTANIGTQHMQRGAVGTRSEAHEAGAAVKEIRVLEGDQLEDILFPVLFSVDGNGTAGPSSGKYDILPPGWGLGLDASLVDVTTLQNELQGRSDYRRYRREEPLDLELLLRWISIATNSIIFWDTRGVLTCVARTDIYPNTTFRLNLKIEHTRVPGMRAAASHIINSVEWSTDYSLDGTPQRIIVVDERESTSVRDRHKGEPVEDPGVLSHRARTQMYTVHRGLLLLRARPVPIIEVDVLWDETNPFLLGELILVRIDAFPNFKGAQGLLDSFEIIDVSPANPEGKVSLTLMMRGSVVRAGLIAPWSEVASVAGSDVTLKAQALTHAAPPGTEDVELWKTNSDPIEFWDVSSFGSGAVRRFATTITAIDVPTKVITVAAVPDIGADEWELAADDLVRLNDYTTVKAGATSADRIGIYIALATGNPRALGVDKPYVWAV